jgi:signal transduction histidine kinase
VSTRRREIELVKELEKAAEGGQATDVRRRIDASIRLAWSEIRRRARLVTHYDEVPRVIADGLRLEQVFASLLNDAARAIPEGDVEENRIVVSTYELDERVVVAITDTGRGAGRAAAGCHRTVEALGGTIEVESRPGAGTTVTVSLPVAHREGAAA